MSAIDDKPALNLKSVVYATDFSQCSQNAGLYAARIAARFSAKLLVAHAFMRSQAALEVEIGDRRVSQQRVHLIDLLSKEAQLLEMNSVKAIPALLEGNPKDTMEWTPKLRQANRTHFSANGELCHGSESTEVHAGV
jgi:hypothetical protein